MERSVRAFEQNLFAKPDEPKRIVSSCYCDAEVRSITDWSTPRACWRRAQWRMPDGRQLCTQHKDIALREGTRQ